MKTRILLSCLLLLVTLSLPVKANGGFEGNHIDYSSDYSSLPPEEWSEEDFSNFDEEEFTEEDFEMSESPDYERIMEIVDEINKVYEALVTELEEYHNRNLKKVVNKLDDCVDIFSEAVGETSEEFPTNCEDAIRLGFKIFNRAISLLEERKCDSVNVTRRCIPAEIADKYIPQLKELYAELEEEVLADDDEDGSPDICTYFEDWEDEADHPQIPEEYDGNNLQ